MLQVATFQLPDQQEEANEFLSTHRPAGPLNFNRDTIIVFYEDGSYPAEYEISELYELLESQRNAIRQQQIALHVLEYQRFDLNPKHNKNDYESLTGTIHQTKQMIDLQEVKMAYVQSRIDALRNLARGKDVE